MNGIGNNVVRHIAPADYDRNSYKIIFNEALLRSNVDAKGMEIIRTVSKRRPFIEVWVDLAERKVVNPGYA